MVIRSPRRRRRRGETLAEQSVERRVRRALAKVGLRLQRDRYRTSRTPAHRGGYRVVDPHGDVMFGAHFAWSLAMAELFADNFANGKIMPERAMIQAFEAQQRNVFISELRQSIATAHAAVESVQRRRA
jgi:hypothetical protein